MSFVSLASVKDLTTVFGLGVRIYPHPHLSRQSLEYIQGARLRDIFNLGRR